jgi:CRP-like cAMP-binding protein
LVLTESWISRYHAVLHCEPQRIIIQDLDSASGLRIGNQIIHAQKHFLQQGERVQFGSSDQPILRISWKTTITAGLDPETPFSQTLDKIFSLYSSDFFHLIQPERLISLAQVSEVQYYEPGEKIFQYGELPEYLFLLVAGTAEEWIEIEDNGQPKQVGIISAGELIGELGVLTNTGRRSTVRATAPHTQVLAIPSRSFEQLLQSETQMLWQLLRLVTTRQQQLLGQLSVGKPLVRP